MERPVASEHLVLGLRIVRKKHVNLGYGLRTQVAKRW